METCKKTKLTVLDGGSTFTYQIKGSEGNKCEVEVTLLEMPPETEEEVKQLFNGKSMTCKLGKGSSFTTEIISDCTGPLKESIYELTIKKMYNILAQSLSDIIAEL
jgi:hypothetical protein